MFIQITGARNWDDETTIATALRWMRPHGSMPGDVVRHGNCKGADKQAGKVAKALGFELDVMPAQWRLHVGYPDTSQSCNCNEWRKANSYCGFAGPRRNRQMLDKPIDIVLAFHPNIKQSKGTKDCVNEAVRRGMKVYLFDGINPPILIKEVIL